MHESFLRKFGAWHSLVGHKRAYLPKVISTKVSFYSILWWVN